MRLNADAIQLLKQVHGISSEKKVSEVIVGSDLEKPNHPDETTNVNLTSKLTGEEFSYLTAAFDRFGVGKFDFSEEDISEDDDTYKILTVHREDGDKTMLIKLKVFPCKEEPGKTSVILNCTGCSVVDSAQVGVGLAFLRAYFNKQQG